MTKGITISNNVKHTVTIRRTFKENDETRNEEERDSEETRKKNAERT